VLLLGVPELSIAASRLEDDHVIGATAETAGPGEEAPRLVDARAVPRGGGTRAAPSGEERRPRDTRVPTEGEDGARGGVKSDVLEPFITGVTGISAAWPSPRTSSPVTGCRWKTTGRSIPSSRLPIDRMVRLVVGGGGKDRAAKENASRLASSSDSSSDSTITPSAVATLTASACAAARADEATEEDDSSHSGTRGANNHDSPSGIDGSTRARAQSPLSSEMVFTSLATIDVLPTTAR